MSSAIYLLSAAAALREDIGAPIPLAQQARLADLIMRVRETLGAGEFALTLEQGCDLLTQACRSMADLHAASDQGSL